MTLHRILKDSLEVQATPSRLKALETIPKDSQRFFKDLRGS